jgi:hypothetical protein
MLVTLTNLSSTTPVYVSSLYTTIAASSSIQTKRTYAQVSEDVQIMTLVNAGSVSLAYTEEAGDDAAGLGGLDAGVAFSQTIRKTFAAGAGGSADDVVIFNATTPAPFAFVITDVTAIISTAVSASTVQLRDTAAGAGTTLSDALATASTGVKRNAAATTAPAVARGGTLIIRRSDSGIAGQVLVGIVRTS